CTSSSAASANPPCAWPPTWPPPWAAISPAGTKPPDFALRRLLRGYSLESGERRAERRETRDESQAVWLWLWLSTLDSRLFALDSRLSAALGGGAAMP